MILLKNERQYRRWATNARDLRTPGAGWDTYKTRWRNEAPTQYPCYAYTVVQDFGMEELTPVYLYLADVEEMRERLCGAETNQVSVKSSLDIVAEARRGWR